MHNLFAIPFRRYYSKKPDFPHLSVKSNIQLNPFWVTGFVYGEGCFTINIYKDKNFKVGWRVRLFFFLIGLHVKDKALLETIKNYFGVGNIYSASEDSLQDHASSMAKP